MIYYLIFIFFLEVFPRPSPNNEPIIKRTSRKQLKPVTCNDSLQKKKKKKTRYDSRADQGFVPTLTRLSIYLTAWSEYKNTH